MNSFILTGYTLFIIVYVLMLSAITYHQRKYMITGDPALRWMRVLQVIISILFLLSLYALSRTLS